VRQRLELTCQAGRQTSTLIRSVSSSTRRQVVLVADVVYARTGHAGGVTTIIATHTKTFRAPTATESIQDEAHRSPHSPTGVAGVFAARAEQ
jgi:hypothetical protein